MTIQISTLSNGLRVVTDVMQGAESVVVGAWVGVGTRHEPWRANGVAHLVEHMMFKGTKKRSAYALSTAIEKHGGTMNAHTTREETAYYARVLPEDTERATDIVADMLLHSVFDPKELDREKQVIIQEIGRDLDSPEDHVFDLMHEQAFPKQKIGRSILGSPDVIAQLPRETALDYVQRHYHTGNMVIVGTGKIDHASFVAMIKKRFRKVPNGRAVVPEKARIVSGGKLADKPIEQLHLILGYPAPNFHNPASYPARVLSVLLGGTSSSRLFQKVREKRGLVYTINSGVSAFSDVGLFQIYAGTDPARAKELINVIGQELRDVTRNVNATELARAKAQIRADVLMGQENVMARADTLGHNMLAYGAPIAIDSILTRLIKVTQDDVQTIAAKLFRRRPIVTALGPLGQLENYRTIAAQLTD